LQKQQIDKKMKDQDEAKKILQRAHELAIRPSGPLQKSNKSCKS
jgi:hypothetical protein